jgi:hypothetical protein
VSPEIISMNGRRSRRSRPSWDRSVVGATVAVVAGVSAMLGAALTRRIRMDVAVGVSSGPVVASDLVAGHRYLLVPLLIAGLVAVAAGIAGVGPQEPVATTFRRATRGSSGVLGPAAATAMVLALALGLVVGATGVLVVVAAGGGAPSAADVAMAAFVLARLSVTAGSLTAFGCATIARGASPGLSFASLLVGEALLELVVLLGSDGSVQLLPFGTVALVVDPSMDASGFGTAPPWTAGVAMVVVWIVLPVVAARSVRGRCEG